MTKEEKRQLKLVAIAVVLFLLSVAIVAFADDDSDSDCDDSDKCPPVTGACCVDCYVPGTYTYCTPGLEQGECEDHYGGNWFEGKSCEEIECEGYCPEEEPRGAGCLQNGSCVTEITLEDFVALSNERSGTWVEGATCEDLVCAQVPTIPWGAYAILAGLFAAIGVLRLRYPESRALFR